MLTLVERRKALTTALRSGKYKQTTGMLQNQYGYCCLGVACAVFEELTGGELLKQELELNQHVLVGVSLLPSVRDFYGFSGGSGEIHYTEAVPAWSLIDLNDDLSWTFEQIADLIDSNPQGLWTDSEPEESKAIPQQP